MGASVGFDWVTRYSTGRPVSGIVGQDMLWKGKGLAGDRHTEARPRFPPTRSLMKTGSRTVVIVRTPAHTRPAVVPGDGQAFQQQGGTDRI